MYIMINKKYRVIVVQEKKKKKVYLLGVGRLLMNSYLVQRCF